MATPPSYQHYVWASGHFILLLSSLRYVIAFLTFKTASAWWYKASYTGALVSYAIVCNKSLGTPQPNLAYVRRAIMDENVQYLLLALFWWTSKPITLTLLPYMIFSLFHALTFTRTTLIPQFMPPSPPATAGGAPGPHPLAKALQAWVKANYDKAMKVVAFTELAIFVRIVLGALTFRNSLLSPVIFAHFLRQRYYHSAFTRDAFGMAAKKIDALVKKPGNPPILVTVWEQGQAVIQRWAGVTLTPNGGVPEQPQAAAH